MGHKQLKEGFLPIPLSVFTNGKLAFLQMKGNLNYVGLYLYLSYFFGISDKDGQEGTIEVSMIDSIAYQTHTEKEELEACISVCMSCGLIEETSDENGVVYLVAPYWKEAVMAKKRLSETRRDAVSTRYESSKNNDDNSIEQIKQLYETWAKDNNGKELDFYVSKANEVGASDKSLARFLDDIMNKDLSLITEHEIKTKLVEYELKKQ